MPPQRLYIVITDSDQHGIGGMETHFLEMVRHFASHLDYATTVLTPPSSSHPYFLHLINKLQIEHHPIIDFDDILGTAHALRNTVKDFSIVFFNSLQGYPLFYTLRDHLPTCRIIARSGGNDIWLPWRKSTQPTDELFARQCARGIAYVNGAHQVVGEKAAAVNECLEKLIVNSAFSLRHAEAHGIRTKKLAKIIGGACTTKISANDHIDRSELVILNVCRITPFKGLRYSIQAFSHAAARASVSLKMIIIGDGDQRSELEAYVREQRIARVEFVGAMHYPEVLSMYQMGDIFLHLPISQPVNHPGFSSFHTETMGRSIIEALAAGLPIVSTAVGGVSEVVTEGETGFLVKEKDYLAAAEKLLALQDVFLRGTLGAQARLTAENSYSWEHVFSHYHQLFKG